MCCLAPPLAARGDEAEEGCCSVGESERVHGIASMTSGLWQ